MQNMRMPDHDRIYFCTNTKISKGYEETRIYLEQLNELTKDIAGTRIDLLVMPPYISLYQAKTILKDSKILIGAQNICHSDEIENTGEISGRMLSELEIPVVMIGHSERRRIYGETDNIIAQKVKTALKHGLTVLLSIGENAREKNAFASKEVLRLQLKTALEGIGKEYCNQIRVLYEPAWAIGANGHTPDPEYIGWTHCEIRNCLNELWGTEIAVNVPLIYGGSVKRNSALDIYRQDNVDGLGIGRAAWDAGEFNQIIRDVLEFDQNSFNK